VFPAIKVWILDIVNILRRYLHSFNKWTYMTLTAENKQLSGLRVPRLGLGGLSFGHDFFEDVAGVGLVAE
jgi:hypothetical protein